MSAQTDQPAVAVLISGRGSNMAALMTAAQQGTLGGRIALVVSNKADAGGLAVAQQAGIPTAVIDHREFETREAFDAALVKCIDAVTPALVCLAGFMRILTPVFTDAFAGRALNIHPSLLPAYPGLHTHQRAIDAGDSHGGTSVHYVTGELDGGPVVLQARVPIVAGDSPEALAQRVQVVEHQIFPMAAQWHLQDKLKLHGSQVLLDGKPLPVGGVQWRADQ